MAKKKAPAAAAAAATAAAPPSAAPAAEPDSGALVESLKNLNSNLIKEVRERQEKMNDLQSCMDLLALEHDFSGDLEGDVTRLGLASYLTELTAEKKVAEDRIGSAEAALVEVRSQLQSIVGQKGEIEKDLERAIVERDLNQFKLAEEEKRKGMALREAEAALVEVRSQLQSIVGQKGEIEKELKRAIVERDLNQFKLAEEEKRKGMALREAEDRIGSAEAALVEVRSQLQSIVGQKGEIEKDLERAIVERDVNQFKLAEEEKRKGMALREAERLAVDLASLEKDKERLQLDMEAQKNDYVRELDSLRDIVQRIEMEKDAINKVRAKKEDEISDLQSELANLTAVASDLNLEKQLVKTLRLQIEELEKNRDKAHDELQKINASFVSLGEQTTNLKIYCDALTIENASLDEKLRKSLQSIKEMEEKDRDTNQRFEKVLTLIKTTSEAINTLEGDNESSPGREIIIGPESDKCMNDITCKLEVIKAIFESKVALIKDKDEQFNLFRIAVEDARKKGALWTWLYPIATTVVAAISVAFAVKH